MRKKKTTRLYSLLKLLTFCAALRCTVLYGCEINELRLSVFSLGWSAQGSLSLQLAFCLSVCGEQLALCCSVCVSTYLSSCVSVCARMNEKPAANEQTAVSFVQSRVLYTGIQGHCPPFLRLGEEQKQVQCPKIVEEFSSSVQCYNVS